MIGVAHVTVPVVCDFRGAAISFGFQFSAPKPFKLPPDFFNSAVVFDKDGKALPIMPFHNEMSDAVFMAGPILAATGKLTGERKYFDAAATHFASMRTLCLRRDGAKLPS